MRDLSLGAVIISLILSSSCDKSTPPIDPPLIFPEFDTSNPYVLHPCYHSIYFDTTLPMKTHDLAYFTVKLPEGSFSKYGIIKGIENEFGGKFGYGCDTFDFRYGMYTPNAFEYQPYSDSAVNQFYKLNRDDYLMTIEFSTVAGTDYDYFRMAVSRTDTNSVLIWTGDYNYDYYLQKVIETIELK